MTALRELAGRALLALAVMGMAGCATNLDRRMGRDTCPVVDWDAHYVNTGKREEIWFQKEFPVNVFVHNMWGVLESVIKQYGCASPVGAWPKEEIEKYFKIPRRP